MRQSFCQKYERKHLFARKEEIMYCANCGKEIDDTSKFCGYCGAQVISADEISNGSETMTDNVLNETTQNTTNGTTENNVEFEQVSNVEPVETVTTPIQDQVKAEAKAQIPNIAVETIAQTPNVNVDNSQQATTKPKKKKKKGKVIAIVCGIVVVLAIGGGVGGYFIYQNFLKDQAAKVISFFDEENYLDSASLYEKYCAENDKLRDEIETKILERIDSAFNAFDSENTSYQEVIDLLDEIKNYGNTKLTDNVDDVIRKIDAIYESRENYKNGESLLNDEDYENAITYFQLVTEDDLLYYQRAQEGIQTAQTAIAEIEERERLEELKEDALYNADYYASDYDYVNAAEVIKEALVSLPEDSDLLNALNNYQTLMAKAEKVDESSLAIEPYDYTYKEDDIDITYISLQIPVLSDDTKAYQYINDQMQQLKENYIGYADDLAEVALSEYTNPYFHELFIELSCEVGYNSNGLLSFIFNGYNYTGGAHGDSFKMTYTYDLASGDQVTLKDIVSLDEDDFQSIVVNAFRDLINSDPESYYTDAIDTVENMYGFDYNFYLGNDGIHIYFYPYVLSYYATEYVEVVIPYKGVINF